ncbi:DUF3526 domain-containing protein [Tolypothrix campylonemoides VB511288]|nr:DUF3526 domain-containing protein [Tolypothrix campylonemoides VB511288]
MSFGTVLKLDARQLVRERLALVVLVVGTVCALAAIVAGSAWIERLAAERAAFLAEAAKTEGALRESLVAGTLGEKDGVLLPTRIARAAAFPVPTLADFSIGRSDIEPTTATLRTRCRADTLFGSYQLDHAERLMRGRLDLAVVAVVVAPLLLIALGYGLFASDRERGTARLILAQAGSPVALLAARTANRFALVLLPLLVAAAVLLALGPDLPHRMTAALLWLGVAALGLLLWWGAVLLVNSVRIGAETAALALVGLWVLTVFVLPASINAGAQALYPPPSRLAQIVDARAAEQRTTQQYQKDHAVVGESAEALRARVAMNYRIGTAIERDVAPRVRAFDAQLARQQAVVQRAQALSPPMVVAGVLASIAGTDAATYARWRGGTLDALAAIKRHIGQASLGARTVDVAFLDAARGYTPAMPAPSLPAWTAWPALLALLAWLFAWIRLRRPRLD